MSRSMRNGSSWLFLLVAVLSGGPWTRSATATSISLGELTVHSQPGVEVAWDGIVLGVTDDQGVMRIGEIPPGRYSLSLRLEGFQSRSIPLEVATGSQALNLPLTAHVPNDSAPNTSVEEALPGPTQSIWPTVLAAVVIVLAAVAILQLARHRPRPVTTTPQADGPKIVLGTPGDRSGRSSGLLRDLKRREDSLENFVDAGSGGLKRKAPDIEVADHRSVDETSGGKG